MILEKDLFLIHKMAFPDKGEVFVLDPSKRVVKNYDNSGFKYVRVRDDVSKLAKRKKPYYLINVSGAGTFSFPLNFDAVEAILSFNIFPDSSVDFYHYLMHYVKDKSNNIRFVISENYRNIDYLIELEQFNAIIDMANLASFFGTSWNYLKLLTNGAKSVSNGSFQILKKDRGAFPGMDASGFQSFIMPLSYARKTDIMTVKFRSGNKWKAFYKIPVNDTAAKLLEKENRILEALNEKKHGKVEFPSCSLRNQHLLIDLPVAVKTTPYHKLHKKYYDEVLDIIEEMHGIMPGEVRIGDLIRKEEVVKTLEFIRLKVRNKKYPAGLAVVKYVSVFKELTDILNNLNAAKKIPAALFNQNLSPEHIGHDGSKLLLLNWDHAEESYPMLFDYFEFVFRYFESLDHAETEELLQDIVNIRNSGQVQGLIEKYNIDFDEHLHVYILLKFSRQMVYLLSKRAIQPEANMSVYLIGEFLNYYRIR